MPISRSEILRLLDKLGEETARAFIAAVEGMRSRAQIARVQAAIERGDIEAALDAAGLRSTSWNNVTEAVRNGYIESGMFVAGADVPRRFGFEFDIRNPRAESWLRQQSSRFITLITEDQRDAVRVILRSGMVAGRNPRSTALDIVGRMSKQTGRRSGGILGLNAPQTEAVIRARTELNSLDSKYFNRTRRDKRFDATVRKAIDSGTPLDQATIDKLTGRYADRLLKLRGDTVGRTEMLAALNEASDEALRQVIDQGLAPPDAVKRIWRHSFSPNERPGHLKMSGQERGIDEPFLNPDTGITLPHPGDGPASEVISCRCFVEHKIDFIKVEQAA